MSTHVILIISCLGSILLSSCSRSASWHMQKFIAKGGTVERDTIFTELTLKSPPVKATWDLNVPTNNDGIIRLRQNIPGAKEPAEVMIKTIRDTIRIVEVKYPEQEVKGKVETQINNTYKAKPKYNFWHGFILGFSVTAIGAIVAFALIYTKRLRKISEPE